MNFIDFTIQRNMICDDVHDLLRYQFWHWFLIGFVIDVGSILVPLWHQLQYFGLIVLGNDFWWDCLQDFDKKGFQILPVELLRSVISSTLFRRWCFWTFLGSLWLPFGSLLTPFWLRVGRFGYSVWSCLNLFTIKNLALGVRICRVAAKQSTPASKEFLIIYIYIYLYIYMFIYPCIHISIYPYIHISINHKRNVGTCVLASLGLSGLFLSRKHNFLA